MAESDGRKVIVKLSENLHRRLKSVAALSGRTMQDLVVEAIEATVEIQEAEHPVPETVSASPEVP